MDTIKIHAYFVSYNEEKILPHLLKYYSSFCDKINIIDNCSNDRTVEIIRNFGNVNLLTYDSNDEIRDDLLLRVKNNCWKLSRGSADYVIVADCDEFLYHPKMEEFLIKAKEQNVSLIKPIGYHMVADEDYDIVNNDPMTSVKLGVREQLLDKYIMFDPNKVHEINYNFGCHMCNPVGQLKIATSKQLYLKHFKFVGLQNYIDRSMSYCKRLSNYNKERKMGLHYNRSEEEVKQDYFHHLNARTEIEKDN